MLDIVRNEKGYIMVWSLLLLIVVTLLGAAGISSSIFEERMAANEALHNQTFFMADGGSENALALLVENINCISGFASLSGGVTSTGDVAITAGSENFWLNNADSDEIDMASNTDRDFYYPSAASDDDPHTNGRLNGRTQLMMGANLPMLAGYEGKGKALGSEGAFLEYDIKVEHIGTRNSRAAVHTRFRLDNQFASYPAGTCIY